MSLYDFEQDFDLDTTPAPYDQEIEERFLPEDHEDLERMFSHAVREHNERQERIGDGFRAAELEALEIPDMEIPEFEI